MFRFAYPYIVYVGLLAVLLACIYRWRFYKEPIYRFSCLSLAKEQGIPCGSRRKKILSLLRTLVLGVFVLLMGRPQWVDSNSRVHVDGIDIILALDVSGSMQCFDDPKDQRSRLEIAKKEAIEFANNREYDQLGLVIFGRDAVSRCPLTVDKKMLQGIIEDISLGVVNADGTALATSLVIAANRLKNSQAKSKIIILLTDGEPTPEIDIDPKAALDVVKKYDIKVYTIGIGGDYGGLINDPFFGMRRMGFGLNKKLLGHIAEETGGQFFEAKNAKDMKRIYATIDALEKTEFDVSVFTRYEDIFKPLLCSSVVGVALELIFSTFIWFAL